MAVNLPHLPDVTKVSPRVIRVLGGNPSKFALQGTNTYIVGQGPERILIDTGEGKPIWSESLQRVLEQESIKISQVILTHWHPDHVRGVPDLLKLCPNAKVHKNQLYKSNDLDIADGQIFHTDGATLKAFHCPGHTVDHMALILLEEDAMFTGDNVLGHGTAVFEDLAAYIDSLGRMQYQFGGCAYPAHGEVIEDGKTKIREYIAHRKEREEQVLNVLKSGTSKSMDMVKIIYKEYPESLHVPAEGGVLQILKKLELEGKIQGHASGTWDLTDKATL
ncbi:Metallo-hydrolase/oxidoreductase [Polychaeton citri CBS 116435]|uniref:Metallo-hydrolase/oxidoreductase n=1 Tax=Polychaeton citri CBS 116435 TaxID=1314669 RepID=A0A9P4Q1A5_9PEZI|nr:Metallo-hydrolase/oxidoreductase [Polychaeton citri CBS 116435]